MRTQPFDMRDAFIHRLFELARLNKNIVFLSADYGAPSLDRFRMDIPHQFINTAISEQNQISVAAGLALAGKRVFVYSIASFITTRCYEQIKIDLCCMNLPVTIIGVGSCYAYGVDGPTHHATEDISIIRALSNINIYSPADSRMAAELADICLNTSSPTYCRFDRGKYPDVYPLDEDFKRGFSILESGSDITIFSTGILVHRAIEVAKKLRNYSLSAQVVDLYRLKPLNSEQLIALMRKTKKIVSLEEHTLNGGLGSIVSEFLADNHLQLPLKRIGIGDDSLYTYGTREKLHIEQGLNTESIVDAILSWN